MLAALAERLALHALDLHALSVAFRTLPRESLLLAAVATLATYAVLPAYDALSLRYVGKPLGVRRTTFASVIAYAFSQSLGLGALTGASIRYRFWSTWGLSRAEVARGVAFGAVTLWLGIASVGGVACLTGTIPPEALGGVVPAAVRALGAMLCAVPLLYLAWSARGGHERRPEQRRLPVPGSMFPSLHRPGLRLAALQVAVGTLDWLLSGTVLYALLAPFGVTLGSTVRVFVLGQALGLVSHVPGGLGVFESVALVAWRTVVPTHVLIAALVAYRAIYYGAPLVLAAVALVAYELSRRGRSVMSLGRVAGRWLAGVVPHVLSLTTFAAGVLLMFSGATPAVHSRLRWLDAFFPLAVIEVSHFAASVAGVILVLLANGIRRRLDAAYHVTVVALVVGIVGSLLKGADYEEALALAVVLAAVVPARPHFFRAAAITSEPLSRGWIAALMLALVSTTWLGLVSFGRVAYSNALWWRFATAADAPRFLRAMAGTTAVVVAFGVARLLRLAPQRTTRPSVDDLARAKTVAIRSPDVRAHLALLGDKSLLFSDSGQSFIMYGVAGRSWVALGDPVGRASEQSELVWRFRELAHRHGGLPVLYQVSRDLLPVCIDLGLTLLKLGEEAHVPLRRFTLEGGSRRGLRRTVHDVERAGTSFEIVAPERVAALLPALQAVSDDWLAAKRTREKGFSLGRFDAAYLTNFPIALARRGGAIVAFANVWTSEARQMSSADLMRFSSAAPRGVMEYLFVRLILWARDEGYESFDLGMAPLSGFEPRALAPAWNRLAGIVYRHGEHFYHFRGLRQYKEKFDPEWEPRYLATPGRLAVPRILANVTGLVSRGLVGAVKK